MMAIYLYALLATLPEEGRELNKTERQHFETQLQERSSHPEKLMIEFQHIPLMSQELNVVNDIRFTEVSLRLAKVNLAERSSIDQFNRRLSDELNVQERYVAGQCKVVWSRLGFRYDLFSPDRKETVASSVFNGAIWVHRRPHMNQVAIGTGKGSVEASRFFPLTKDSRSWTLLDRYRPEVTIDGNELKASFISSPAHSSELLFTWPECRLLQATHFVGTKVKTATFWMRSPSSDGIVPDAIYDLKFNDIERLTNGRILLIHKSTTDVKLGAADLAVAADSGTMLFDYRQGRRPKPQLLEKQTPNVLQLNVD